MPDFLDRLIASFAGRWHWARIAGLRAPIEHLNRYARDQRLDAWQRYAVVSPGRDISCVAGAGSGKTTVLTARIAFLIDRREVPPSRIRAVTFMKKAAAEMEARVGVICPGVGHPVISTIHSLCYREILNLSGGVNVVSLTRWWSSPEGNNLRGEIVRPPLLDAYRAAGGASDNASARDIVFEVGRDLESLECARINVEAARLLAESERTGKRIAPETIKRIALLPEELLQRAPLRPEQEAAERALRDFYVRALHQYQDFKTQRNRMDFNDLLGHAAVRLIRDAALRGDLQARYDHLLIDEYQDTSPIQILILEYLLRDPEASLFVVGDDWQSICGFQDSDPRWLVHFDRRHRGARRIALGINYRCKQPVVEASTGIIRQHRRLAQLADKRVRASRRGSQPSVEKFVVPEEEEAGRIREAVERQLSDGQRSARIFVLARSNGWLSRLARAFDGSTIPYEVRDEAYSRAPLADGTEDSAEEESLAPSGKVVLTTIHRAKGLEADFVHVAGLSDWLLPTRFRDTLIDRVRGRRERNHLGEELRVLYVGMTRAQESLTLWIPCWHGRQQPSRFLPPNSAWCRTTNHVKAAGSSSRRNKRSGSATTNWRRGRPWR